MIWIAQFCFASFWLAAGAGGMGLLLLEGPAWIAWLSAGVAAAFAGTRRAEIAGPRGLGAVILLGAIPAVLLPFPFNAPAILMAIAGGCWFCARLRAVAVAFGVSAGILAVQAAAVALVPLLSSQIHEAPIGGLLHSLALLSGADSSLHSGRLFISAAGVVHEYGPLVELTGLWSLLPFLASGVLVAGRRALRFLGVAAIFLAVRWAAVLALSLDGASILPFANPWIAIGALGLFATLLWRFMPARPEPPRIDLVTPAPAAVLACAAGFCATAALLFSDPGERKAGRILVDEFHSNWEWTEDRLGKDVYGEKTVYNYYCLMDHLAKFHPSVERNRETLTPGRLAACDVLILKTPTRPYSPAEVRAVSEFVRAGGGLWMIGDHTDVLGMNTCLNAVAREFGMEFQPDSICGLREPWLQPYAPPAAARHPVVQRMPPMIFATSCSLKCGPGVRPVIRSEETFADEIDYGIENFVADMKPSGREGFGSFIQCASATAGRGRVVAFADSTLFSNFFIHLPGIHEVAMESVEWLNRRDAWTGLRATLLVLTILLAAGLAVVMRRPQIGLLAATAPALLSGIALGVFATDAFSRYESPPRRSPFTTVAFDFENPSYRMPLTRGTPAFHGDSYHTFFVWMQRIGMVPQLRTKFADCLDDEAMVMIEPREARDVERLKAYVERGGTLVVLDDPGNPSSTANEILAFSGLSFGKVATEKDVFPADEGASFGGVHLEAFRAVEGGRPILAGNDATALAVAQVGKGFVAAFGAARLFTVDSMGETSTIPDEAQQGVYRLQYWLFEDVLGIRPKTEGHRP